MRVSRVRPQGPSSVEPTQNALERHCRKERVRKLVVARCDRAVLFHRAEEPFDEMTLAVRGEIRLARNFAISF